MVLARRLKLARRAFAILEPERPGGLIKTRRQDGFLLEQGPSVYLDKAGFASFLDEIGLGPRERVYPRVRRFGQYIWFGEAPAAVPKSPGAFLRTPLFSLCDKAVLAGLPLQLPRRGWLAAAGEDESIAEFLGRLLGPRVVANVIDPALKGIYGGNAAELSARSVFPLLWQTLADDGSLLDYIRARRKLRASSASRPGAMFMLRAGGESLTRRLTDGLNGDELVAAAAKRLHYRGAGKGFEIVTSTAGTFSSKRVYVATAGPDSAVYLSALDDELSRALAGLRYASLAVVHCSVARDAPIQSGGFGVLFPGGQPSRLLGVMYNSELFPHVAPADRHLLTVCLGGSGAAEVCQKSDAELSQIVRSELRDRLRVEAAEILAVQRRPRAIPQYEVGHFRLTAKMRKLEQDYAGLHFVGVDVGGVAVPDRVSSALQVEMV